MFFFKQRTAYELVISDLSSIVCSSDLKLPIWDAFLILCRRCLVSIFFFLGLTVT